MSNNTAVGRSFVGSQIVQPGQAAVIKVDSFPFTWFETIEAEVVSVAYDALPADQVSHAVTDAAKARAEPPIAPSATPMTDLVFEARLRPKTLSVNVNGAQVSLTPGMTVMAEVSTEKQSLISYLTGALLDCAEESMHER